MFRDGLPYRRALGAEVGALAEMKKVRNAIAHDSDEARDKFKGLVRSKLGTAPPGCKVGDFFAMSPRGTVSTTTWIEQYFHTLILLSEQIVPI